MECLSVKNKKILDKHGVEMVVGEGFAPPNLQVMNSFFSCL